MICCAWRRCRGGGRVALSAALTIFAAAEARGQETCQTASPVPIGAAFTGSNSAAVTDPQAGLCVATSRDVWHSFTPAVGGAHTISLCGSAFDTVAALYDSCDNLPLICDDDSCDQQSQIVAVLNAGQPYLLRIGSAGASAGGSYRVTITPPAGATPSNNACGAPIMLPQNQVVIGSSAGATGSDLTPGCGALDRADVWYNFAPQASGLHILELCSSSFDAVLSVHTSCVFTSPVACSDDQFVAGCVGSGARIAFNATVGQPFLVRVAGTNDSFGAFSLILYTARSNDLCSSAIQLQLNVPYNGFTSPAVGTETAVGCAQSAGDVWHSYSATVSGPHTFNLCGANFDSVISVHSGCPGEPGSFVLACDDNGCGGQGGASIVTADLTVGQTYFIRVAGRVNGGSLSTGSYSLLTQITPPLNDSCSSPAVLTVGSPVAASTAGSTGADQTPGCGSSDRLDIWYQFSAPAAGDYEFNTCGSVIDTTLALFAGCSTLLACVDDDPAYCGAGSRGARITRTLGAGASVLVRVAGVNDQAGRFQVVVNRVPPPNDSCANAAVLPIGVLTGGSLTGASGSGTFSPCEPVDTADVFYVFTPDDTRAFQIQTCGSTAATALSLLAGCPPAAEIACATQNGGLCQAAGGASLTAVLRGGTPYRVRVAGRAGSALGAFQVLAISADPPNDACDRAVTVLADQPLLGTNRGATGTDISPCGGGDARDVWFRFVPELSGSYEISTCSTGTPLDTTLSVFEECPESSGASGLPIACNDDDDGTGACAARLSRVVVRLTAGLEYLVRVAAASDAEGSFTLVVRSAVPGNDQCAQAQPAGIGITPFDTLGASNDPITIDNTCGLGITQILNDVWFSFTPSVSGTVIASVCGASFDTAIAISSGGTGCTAGIGSVVACNDDYDCDMNPQTTDPQSRVSFAATAGQAYLIRIGSRTGARGAGELRITQPGIGCPCDWNRTGGLTLQDLFDFLSDWFAGAADFNGSGQTTIDDLFGYLGCYLERPAGCGG